MKWSSIFLVVGMCALILAMTIPCTSAAGTAEPKEFDYEKGDYKTVKDWSKVDWTKIPPGRMPDVPANKIDFTKISGAQIGALSPAQKNAVSAAQIQEHLEKLGDLSKYGQARQAIQGKYGVKVDSLGKGAQIQGGALSATFGKKGTLDLAGKQLWEVMVAQDGRILVTGPAELGEAGITRRDSFHIDKPVSLTLKDGRKIKDVRGISYKNGQAFVPKGASATLDDYYFPAQKNAVAVFFGPPPAKPGNYVAFLPDELAIGTTKKGFVELKPQPGNALFGMVRREYAKDAKGNPIKDRYKLVDDTNAALTLSAAGGDSLRVTSREREGKTPLIETAHTKKGSIEITTGRDMRIVYRGKKEWISPPPPLSGTEGALESSDLKNSVAFELTPPQKQPAGVVVGGTSNVKAPVHSIITTSSNRFALVTENGKEYAGTDMGLIVSTRQDINQIKTLDDLRARYPHIDFGMPEVYVKTQIESLNAPKSYTEITAHMAQLTDQWLQQNPEKQGYLAAVQFNTHANAEAIAGQLHKIGEESNLFLPSKVRGYGDRGVMLLGERILDPEVLQSVGGIRNLESPLEILDHEVEHETRHIIERREGSTSAWDGVEQGTLNAFYQQTLSEQSKRLYADESFKKLLGEIDELRRKNSVPIPTYEPTLAPNVPEDEQRVPIIERTLFYADAIQKTEEQLMRLKNDGTLTDEDKARAAELYRRFNEVIKERTGLYPYSFKGGTYEFSATYGELSPQEARKCLDCAQLEFDQVMSLDPAPALRKKAEERYNKIMGSACKTRQCGPCTMYKKTCNPNAGQS